MLGTQRTLHDAIKKVLLEQPQHMASADLLSDEIARRNLYLRKNGEVSGDWQVMMRARNHPELFDLVDEATVRLRAL
ncbi:MAG TPA: hypothetical protein VH370_09620 [Humisphaera sp.]|nr:hypothetical protein [Humisphaera sp.]